MVERDAGKDRRMAVEGENRKSGRAKRRHRPAARSADALIPAVWRVSNPLASSLGGLMPALDRGPLHLLPQSQLVEQLHRTPSRSNLATLPPSARDVMKGGDLGRNRDVPE